MRRLLDTDMQAPTLRSRTNPPHFADITLHILNSTNNLSKQIRYLDCIPTSLGDIQFESTSSGDTYITFGASFRFSYFELKNVNTTTGSITDSFTVTTTL